MNPYIVQLFAGKVKQVGDPQAKKAMEKPWKTGMFKEKVNESIWLSKTGLIGDEVADTKHHGGPEKALFAYPVQHYDYWKKELTIEEMNIGDMGENLAVCQLDEECVYIGDTYQLGEAVIQVSQPRQPCWKPARRFRKFDFALRLQESGKTGWYFRVIKEGFVQGNTELILLERLYPQWSIQKCNEVMHIKKEDLKLAEELASCSSLAENWKKTLQKRLAGETSSIDERIYGPNLEK